MLKITTTSFERGMRFCLPEEWHEKVMIFSKVTSFPYEFIIDSIIDDKDNRETYYICVSEKKEAEEQRSIVLTEYIIKYLWSEEEILTITLC